MSPGICRTGAIGGKNTHWSLIYLILSATTIARAGAASTPGPVAVQPAAAIERDLAALAMFKPRPCPSDQPIPAVGGWVAGATQCVWQDRLQMRQWQATPAAGASDCVDSPARWWSAARQRWGMADGPAAWNSTWQSQILAFPTAVQKQFAIIERTNTGTWIATEWRWTPSPREATREWQKGRWNLLMQTAARHQQKSNVALVAADAMPLLTAWDSLLGSRAGEISPDGWRWESAGLCMRMETAGISQAQLHLPYSREDSRLEQRAAMQLRLARTYPKATWLTPFRILPASDTPPVAATTSRGGAIYQALWRQDAAIKGQLWMPQKTGGAIQRARISVALEAPVTSADDPRVTRIATAIEQELTQFSKAVAAGNER
jgi:hypothetical protein